MANSEDANAHRTPQEVAGPPSRPRWVKVVLILALLLVVVVGAMIVLGGGQHGPGRHMQMLPRGSHSALPL